MTSSSDRHGTVLRGAEEWSASLALAGNPVEEFVVAKDRGLDQVIAFLRGCMLNGAWQALEWACAEGHEGHLAELIAATQRTVGQDQVLAPALADPRLESSLLERGLREVRNGRRRGGEVAAEWMLRCLRPESLAKRFGVPVQQDGPANDVLNMILPPPTFHFWTADRF